MPQVIRGASGVLLGSTGSFPNQPPGPGGPFHGASSVVLLSSRWLPVGQLWGILFHIPPFWVFPAVICLVRPMASYKPKEFTPTKPLEFSYNHRQKWADLPVTNKVPYRRKQKASRFSLQELMLFRPTSLTSAFSATNTKLNTHRGGRTRHPTA